MSQDFWESAAAKEVADPPKTGFSGPPDGAMVIARTANQDDKEGAHPKLKDFTRKSDGKVFWKFKIPMQIVGGDNKITSNFVGRGFLFPDFYVEKSTEAELEARITAASAAGYESTEKRLRGTLKSLDKLPCSPELYNLMLDCLAPEGDDTQVRWSQCLATLGAKANAVGLTLESCNGNDQYLYAAAFRAVLMETSFEVIGKLYTPKDKDDGYTPQQTIGTIGAFTEAEAKRRKVKIIAPEAREEF